MVYCLDALKGTYTETPCDLAKEKEFAAYEQGANMVPLDPSEHEKKWGKVVRRSWNALLNSSEGSLFAKEILMAELDDLDRIFLTHFEKSGEFFMTNGPAWTEMWPLYVEAVILHAEEASERPEANGNFVKLRESVSGKLRFMMKNHGELYMAPPFPILTKSVVPMIIKSVQDIEMALYEVSHHCYCIL